MRSHSSRKAPLVVLDSYGKERSSSFIPRYSAFGAHWITKAFIHGGRYYWMHGAEFLPQFLGVAQETDMADCVSLRNQRWFYITLPALQEQVQVAHILRSLKDKIELNWRMCATLEEMARAIFRSWFVDFDPVREKVGAIAEGPRSQARLHGRHQREERGGSCTVYC